MSSRKAVWRARYSPFMSIALGRPGALQPVSRAGATAARTTLRHIRNHPAVQRQRNRACARYIGWQIWQRTTRRPVTIDLHGSVRLRCHPHSTSASAVLYCRLPDWMEMRFLLDYLNPGDVFVDVGANVGVYTLLAASLPGVHCIAFEPSSDSWDQLIENINLNQLSQVEVHRVAVGDQSGEIDFTIGHGTVNQVASPDIASRRERVPVVRLDDVVPHDRRVTLIKIDVEGHEPAVLDGARALIERLAPALLVEYNHPARLRSLLDELDYHPVVYNPETRAFRAIELDRESPKNILALKKSILDQYLPDNGVGTGRAKGTSK
ncbi:methyltransferase FkbM family [Parafrankia sp. EAN1pec]|nr:methyltransferase FkbM family [Frankia sp. EAN1pec]